MAHEVGDVLALGVRIAKLREQALGEVRGASGHGVELAEQGGEPQLELARAEVTRVNERAKRAARPLALRGGLSGERVQLGRGDRRAGRARA